MCTLDMHSAVLRDKTERHVVWHCPSNGVSSWHGTYRETTKRIYGSRTGAMGTWQTTRSDDLQLSSERIPAHPRCFEYSFPLETIDGILLPGGRRLIIITRSRGVVYQYDLDSLGSQLDELIPAKQYNDESGGDDVHYAIWIDDSQPRLSFSPRTVQSVLVVL